MSEYRKTGHPILGVILGLLGIAAAIFLAMLAGVIGGGIAIAFGLAALLIGISGRKKGGKGIGAIIVGALAILLAVALTATTVGSLKEMHQKAVESGNAPLVAKYAENPYLGLLGVALKLPNDEGTLQELTDQLNLLK